MIARIIILCWLAVDLGATAQVDPEVLLRYEWEKFHAVGDSAKSRVAWAKINARLRSHDLSEEVNAELREMSPMYLSREEEQALRWNKALLAFVHGELHRAKAALDQYQAIGGTQDRAFYLLYFQVAQQYGAEQISGALDSLARIDSTFQGLSCLCELDSMTVKAKVWPVVLSAIVPGAGMIAQGEVAKGTGALLMNGLLGVGIYALWVNQLPVNAVLWGVGLIPRFYLGNLQMTSRISEQKRLLRRAQAANECAEQWRIQLDRYPLLPK